MNTKELAEELIGFRTVSPVEEPDVFEFVKVYLEDQGIETQIHDSGGVYSLTAQTGSGKPRVCLNGHLDVVEAGEGWQITDPFEPRVKDGKLYGRGATDMKGAAAAMIKALVDLDRSEFSGTATLMLVGDEEVGGEKGTKQLVKNRSFDYAILGEPTDLDVQVGTRGLIWLDVKVKGESRHASRPEYEGNVMDRVPEVLERLNQLEMSYEEDDMLPDPTGTVTRLHSDDTYNSIPSSVKIGMDFRYIPGQSTETLTKDIENALEGLEIDFEVEIVDDMLKPTKLADPEFRSISAQTVRSITGRKPRHITEGGASDGRFFSPRGTPFVELGSNQQSVHSQDEYIELEVLRDLRKIYKEIPERLAKKQSLSAGTRSRMSM